MTTELQISQISINGGTQPRCSVDPETIFEYAEAMAAGAKFPPVEVYYDGDTYWCVDGFHRIRAAMQIDRTTIAAIVHQGTLADAQWFSFGVNKSHGLKRTNEDKQRAVQAALKHVKSVELSDREIAKHVGVDQKTVLHWRKQLESSKEIPKIETRTVTRNGTTYQQNTANIGRRPVAPVQTPAPEPLPVATVARPAVAAPVAPSVATTDTNQEFEQGCLVAVIKAAEQLRDCPMLSGDLARLINQVDSNGYIKGVLNTAYEFIEQILHQR